MKDEIALIVIDVVNGCCAKECETPDYGITFTKIREMVPRLEKFIGEYRERVNRNVFMVNLTPWTAEYLPENIRKLYENPEICYYGDGGFEEEFYAIKPASSDKVITKNTYDAFMGTELDKLLRERGVREIVVAGVFTDGCVLSTIINGFSRGYNFTMLRDLVETTDLPVRRRLQEDLLEYTLPMQYGKVLLSGDFLDSGLFNAGDGG